MTNLKEKNRMKVYIVLRIGSSTLVASVWSTNELAQLACRYHRIDSLNNDKFMVIEREVDTAKRIYNDQP